MGNRAGREDPWKQIRSRNTERGQGFILFQVKKGKKKRKGHLEVQAFAVEVGETTQAPPSLKGKTRYSLAMYSTPQNIQLEIP